MFDGVDDEDEDVGRWARWTVLKAVYAGMIAGIVLGLLMVALSAWLRSL
jgi:hypothetical protein